MNTLTCYFSRKWLPGLMIAVALVGQDAAPPTLAQTQPQKSAQPNAVRQRPTAPNIVFIVADDLSPTLGCYSDSTAPTPTIDRLARQGVLFENAFCTAPSCSPSRASMLTGRYPHQLAEGTNLWGTLPERYTNFVNLLEKAGYQIGLQGKGWGPGDHTVGGYTRNPAGPSFKSFGEFMNSANTSKPFFFWLGSQDPHRPYQAELKQTIGLRPQYLTVPANLPDTPDVRDDLLDYYAEVARFDQTVANVVETLEKAGQLQNTLIVVTGDNGMPFPRAKANLYDAGSRVPLIILGGAFSGSKRIAAPVSLVDLAPTFLEWAGLPKAAGMEGRSLLRFTSGRVPAAEPVFIERERHAQVRAGNIGYPARAIRTPRFLYIQNIKPDRWPAGDPRASGVASSPGQSDMSAGAYGDIDNGPAKRYLIEHRDQYVALADGALNKRPAEELYDLQKDPNQQHNVVELPSNRAILAKLRQQLQAWRQRTGDPRLTPEGDLIDTYPYYGNRAAKEPK